jgi:hypothetical protein
MLGKVFNTAAVDEYADWVLSEVKKQLPPRPAPGASKDIGQRAEKLNERISLRTIDFAKTTKLNLYKKARLTARVRGDDSARLSRTFHQIFLPGFTRSDCSRIATSQEKVIPHGIVQ